MKTLILIALSSLMLTAGLTGCGSSNNSSSASTQYSYVGGVCYNTATSPQTPVATSYCTGTAYNASLFSWNGTTCTNLQTGQSVNTGYCTSNPFASQSGGCYDSIAGTYTSAIYCTTVTTTGNSIYTYVNGICENTQTLQQVSSALCTTTSIYGTSAQSCIGTYYYYYGQIAQLIYCNGTNCRGQTLYSIQTKQPVLCE